MGVIAGDRPLRALILKLLHFINFQVCLKANTKKRLCEGEWSELNDWQIVGINL